MKMKIKLKLDFCKEIELYKEMEARAKYIILFLTSCSCK